MEFPFLSVIIMTPIAGALVLLLIPGERKTEIRMVALAAAFISMALSVYVFFSYDVSAGGFQFEERLDWIPQLGVSYHVGVDGVSAPMVLLTGLVIFTGVLISWGLEDRPREFFTFLLLLVAGVFGVFVALDLFALFFFYELSVFPMYLLIATWGWKNTRTYAAMKLTLYLIAGSIIAMVGALAMYFSAGLGTFDMVEIAEKASFSAEFQRLWFPFVFIGFGVLAGVWPFHNWSPDGHVAAPTAVSMLHAGVLMKVGAYSALRVAVWLLPEGARYHLPWIIFLTTINVVYGSLIAMSQKDFKYVIGFSSVSHMGLVSMGFATMNVYGLTGAGLQMFSHGAMTALFFACVGMVYDRAHTRHIPSLGGMAQKMPTVAVAFIIGGLVSMGMPGLSGFVAEFPIFIGLWKSADITLHWGHLTLTNYYPVIAMLSITGVVVTAAYVLRVVQSVFFGPFEAEKYHDEITDLNALD